MITVAALALGGCSGASGAADYSGRLASARADADSLDVLRQELRRDNDGAQTLLDQTVDSAAQVRAVAIVAAMTPERAAAFLLANPSRQLITEVWHSYMTLADHSEASQFSTALLHGFMALPPDEQAEFLTRVATTAEVGRYMESGDTELLQALRKRYATDPDSLSAFENACAITQ